MFFTHQLINKLQQSAGFGWNMVARRRGPRIKWANSGSIFIRHRPATLRTLPAALPVAVVTYLAPNYAVVLIGRVMVAARNAIRATSIVLGGVSLATVLGVPTGTIIGEHEGWHAIFAALALLSLGVFTAIIWSIPAVQMLPRPSMSQYLMPPLGPARYSAA